MSVSDRKEKRIVNTHLEKDIRSGERMVCMYEYFNISQIDLLLGIESEMLYELV